MNPNEKICARHDTSCFGDEIPAKFVFDGNHNNSCSFIFPEGYSIFVEQFDIDLDGPDNFVLLDGKEVEYHSVRGSLNIFMVLGQSDSRRLRPIPE